MKNKAKGRVTHMTVAHTCKRGASALTRKGTTYSLKASPSGSPRVHAVGEILFSAPLSLSLSPSACPPSTSSIPCLGIVAIRLVLRKGRENRFRSLLPLSRSAIQYRNLFQFHGSLFATSLFPRRRLSLLPFFIRNLLHTR